MRTRTNYFDLLKCVLIPVSNSGTKNSDIKQLFMLCKKILKAKKEKKTFQYCAIYYCFLFVCFLRIPYKSKEEEEVDRYCATVSTLECVTT